MSRRTWLVLIALRELWESLGVSLNESPADRSLPRAGGVPAERVDYPSSQVGNSHVKAMLILPSWPLSAGPTPRNHGHASLGRSPFKNSYCVLRTKKISEAQPV